VPENAPKVNYRLPGFLSKFIELQEVMWTTNQGLTARHAFDSRPEHWPILRRGIVRLRFITLHPVSLNPRFRTSGSRTTGRSTLSATLWFGTLARGASSSTSPFGACSYSASNVVSATLRTVSEPRLITATNTMTNIA
jgi:hypothetical protein